MRGELVHIQFNEANGELQVINNLPEAVKDAVAHVAVYNLDGTLAYEHETKVTAQPDVADESGRNRVSCDGLAGSLHQAGIARRRGQAAFEQLLLAQPAGASRRFQRSEQAAHGHA